MYSLNQQIYNSLTIVKLLGAARITQRSAHVFFKEFTSCYAFIKKPQFFCVNFVKTITVFHN